MLKMSQLINMDVYTDKADFVGKVHDVIIDLQKGEAVRLTLEPIRASDPQEAKRIFKEKTIMYKSVRAVEKIVIVSSNPLPVEPEEVAPAAQPQKAVPYSARYRRHF